MTKKLENLLKALAKSDVSLTGITSDSKKIKKGDLFVAIKGSHFDGHKFVPQAISRGALVIVGEEEPEKLKLGKATYVKVQNSRKALSLLASAWYNYPARKLKVIGVTGTDGKTTTVSLIDWLLVKAGKKVGAISTIGAKIGEKVYDTGFHITNPEPLDLQRFLAKMVREKCQYAILEVTSHGLDQERVFGIDFEMAVLTNISHEHLDYHQTFQKYLAAKAKLFNSAKIAILNKSDRSYSLLKGLLKPSVRVINYSAESLGGEVKRAVQKRFPEIYNQLNAAGAILVAQQLKVPEKTIVQSIKSFPGVSGRMEEVKNKRGFKVIIDFAHTPNALENVLQALEKRLPQGKKLIVVLGCAGERDVAKRPMMGEVSTRLADISIFTAEDPRYEDVKMIIRQMFKGARRLKVKKEQLLLSIPKRGKAIAYAIQKLAKKGDILVICGKGHEKSMAYNGIEYPWSDYQAVKTALKGGVLRIRRR